MGETGSHKGPARAAHPQVPAYNVESQEIRQPAAHDRSGLKATTTTTKPVSSAYSQATKKWDSLGAKGLAGWNHGKPQAKRPFALSP